MTFRYVLQIPLLAETKVYWTSSITKSVMGPCPFVLSASSSTSTFSPSKETFSKIREGYYFQIEPSCTLRLGCNTSTSQGKSWHYPHIHKLLAWKVLELWEGFSDAVWGCRRESLQNMQQAYIKFSHHTHQRRMIQGCFQKVRGKKDSYTFLIARWNYYIYTACPPSHKNFHFLCTFSGFWNCPRTIDNTNHLYSLIHCTLNSDI